MQKPAISILLAVHNGKNYLKQAVQSVLDQDCDKGLWELIIGSNGCDEENYAYYKEQILPMLRSQPAKMGFHPLQGKSITLNKMLAIADGSWVAIIDHDDVWEPNKLRLQHAALGHKDYANTSVLGTWFNYIDLKGAKMWENHKCANLSHSGIMEQCYMGNNQICNSSVLIKHSALTKAGGWDPKWDGLEDYHLWLRMLNQGFIFNNLPYYSVNHRIHEKSNFNATKTHQSVPELLEATGAHLRANADKSPVPKEE